MIGKTNFQKSPRILKAGLVINKDKKKVLRNYRRNTTEKNRKIKINLSFLKK